MAIPPSPGSHALNRERVYPTKTDKYGILGSIGKTPGSKGIIKTPSKNALKSNQTNTTVL